MNRSARHELAFDADTPAEFAGTFKPTAAPAAPSPAVPAASGLYLRRPKPGQSPLAPRDELRLDVDGSHPQQMASGTLRHGLQNQYHWIARLVPTSPSIWTGSIVYGSGTGTLPNHDTVTIARVHPAILQTPRLRVTFSTKGDAGAVLEYDFVSRGFDPVEFEFDATADAHPALEIDTHAHPDRPSGLPAERLTVAQVFERAGFDVRVASAGPPIPIADAGADGAWSDAEMHDAMQAHWSRYADRAQWALWVLHAALHEQGPGLGGVMFDDIGPHHRQGTAVFTESFIARPPAGDPAPDAWIARMRFWTACHEMGHAFNLAHAWQKSLGTPWMPMSDAPESRSFMNYPFRVQGGASTFFRDFEFRFDDAELGFLRHAPRGYVQMGNADWFDHHGFEQAQVSREPGLRLVARLNRDTSLLQFLEPAMIELKLSNVSSEPMLVRDDLLTDAHQLTLVVKRSGHPARQWHPYATACHRAAARVLAPGESMYAPVFVGAGGSGWLVAEPGQYTIQACLHLDGGEDVLSEPLALRVAAPAGFDEERAAQDLFCQDVGRVFAFDGTRELAVANDALAQVVQRMPGRAVSTHARVALGMPLRRAGKVLAGDRERTRIALAPARPDQARELLGEALLAHKDAAACTLGHVEYRGYVEAYTAWLAREGEVKQAKAAVADACTALGKRKVKPSVLAEMRAFGDQLSAAPAPAAASRRRKG